MGRKCEFIWCSNRHGDTVGKSFHSFPKDETLCQTWVLRCRSAEASAHFLVHGRDGFAKKKLCADHFPLEAFRNPAKKEQGLLFGAVPFDDEHTSEAIPSDSAHEHIDVDSGGGSVNLAQVPSCIEVHENRKPCKDSRSVTSRMSPIEYIEGDSDFFKWLETRNKEILELSVTTHAKDDSISTTVNTDEPSESLLVESSIKHDDLITDFCSFDDNVQASSTTVDWFKKKERVELNQPEVVPFDASNSLPSTEALLRVERKKCQQFQNKLTVLKRQLFVLKQTSDRRLQSLKKQKQQVSKLRLELKMLRKQKTYNEELGKQAIGNPLIMDSLRNAQRKPRGRRYHPMTMKFASSTYLSGPRTYRFVRNSKCLVLPHKNSVYAHNKCIRIDPGLNKPILTQIKQKVRHIKPPRDKIVTIAIDGMAVKSELSYSAKADLFYGFPDDGVHRKVEKNDTTKLATEAVTIMLSGLYRRFKQPIGYVLAHNTLGSASQLQWIKNSVRAVRRCGLVPKVIAMDQCATNEKMVREAGATQNAPFIEIDDAKIAIMYDTPHLTKNTRNALFKYNAVFNNMVASFVHIRQLNEIDQPPGLTLVPKLKEKNVNLPPFAAMNVALATRTLSESCAIGMRHYVHTDELPVAALQTAEFIEMHDKLFDTFNSKDKYSESVGKPYRSPITDDSKHFQFLERTLKTLEDMYYTLNSCFDVDKAKEASQKLRARQKQPHYIKGFIGNIYAIIWLWNEVKTQYACSYMCTNPLCQDCLENFFAEIRRRCGFNDAPNAFQFGSAFKYAMIAATEENFDDGQNCQTDHVEPLLNEQDLDSLYDTNLTQTQAIFDYGFEELDLVSPFTALEKEMNALVYIIGAAVRKMPHLKCREKLTVQRDHEFPDNEDYQFCKLKKSLSTRNVAIPNSTLYDIGLLAFVSFKQKFRKFLYENRKSVKSRLKMYLNYESFDYATCKPCFNKLVDVIFNTLIQGFLREVRLQNKIAVNNKRGLKRNRKAVRMNLPETK